MIPLRAALGSLALVSALGIAAVEACFAHATRHVEARLRAEREAFEPLALAMEEVAGRYVRGAEELTLHRSRDCTLSSLAWVGDVDCMLPSVETRSGRWRLDGSTLELRESRGPRDLAVGRLDGRLALLDESGAWLRSDAR